MPLEEDEPIVGAESREAEDVMGALSEGRSRPPVGKVYRFDEVTGKEYFMDEVDASLITEEWMVDTYGGGSYRVKFYGPRAQDNGKWGYMKLDRFDVHTSHPFLGPRKGRIQPQTGPVMQADGRPVGATSQSLLDMGVMQLFKSMQDNSVMMMQMMKDNSNNNQAAMERLARPAESQIVPLLTVLVPLFTPLLGGMVNRKDPVEIAREIAGLLKPEPTAARGDVLSQFRELLELRELLGGGGNSDDEDGGGSWMRMLEKVVPGALEILKAEASKASPVPPMAAPMPMPTMPRLALPSQHSPTNAVPLPYPASVAGVPSPNHPTMGGGVVADEWTPLEPYMQQLADAARSGKTPHQMAQVVMVFAPEQQKAALREIVNQNDIEQVLLQRFPALQPFPTWVTDFIDELYTEFYPDNDEQDVMPEGAIGAPLPTGESSK